MQARWLNFFSCQYGKVITLVLDFRQRFVAFACGMVGQNTLFFFKKIAEVTEVKVKWSYMPIGWFYQLAFTVCFLFNSFALYFYFVFFPHLNLMGIILRVFQGINLHRTFLDFYFLLSAIKIGGNCKDKDRRCSGWTRYCSYHKYVRANCKKTCKLCWAHENGGKLVFILDYFN